MNRRAFKNELLKFSDGLRKEQITKPTLHKWSARGKIYDILESNQLISDIFRNSIFQHRWLFEFQAQCCKFPAKTLSIGNIVNFDLQ